MKDSILKIISSVGIITALVASIIGYGTSNLTDAITVMGLVIYGSIYEYLYRKEVKKGEQDVSSN